MAVKGKILIIEDDRAICNFMRRVLEANGYEPLIVNTGREAISMLTSHCPDVVILDLGLPDMDGMDVLTDLRRWSLMPVVVVSTRTDEREKVRVLDAGADDYITKPFGTSELLARIRTAVRHTRMAGSNADVARSNRFQAKGLVIDYDKYRVYIDGVDANLTQNEFKLVALLGRYAGRVLTYDYLIREIWGPNKAYDNQILRVNMANIRRKIEKNPGEPQYIFTEVGVGYRMIESDL
ncbi:MAG: response regulator transcription factor [Clostridia bacterium]|nr:response regulator transcription factor [Clostridia bacterium]